MARDPIRLGETGILRVQFLDSNSQPIQASSVTVDLFAPGLDPEVDTPTLAAQTPIYLGNGIFQLIVTAISPAGTWVDKWTGFILGTSTTFQSSYSVINTGSIAEYLTPGLQSNTLVEVFLSGNITSTSDLTLGTDTIITFTTTYCPLYSSIRKVKLDAGGLITAVPDDTINLAILEASLEADVLSFRKEMINNNVYLHARRQYVTCLAAQNIAQNLIANGGLLKSKALADFKVEYDTAGNTSALVDKLGECIRKWEAQLQSGGGARAIRNPKMVIKGEFDPDRPANGRLWYRISTGELPIGNNKYRVRGSRKWRTGYRTSNSDGGVDW